MESEFPSIWLGYRVAYADTDTMGMVYYANYLVIFERARDAYIRLSGMSYREVEEKGIFLPVREVQCRYRASAHFDDVLYCHTGISAFSRASLTFSYELMDETRSKLLVSGATQHAVVDKTGKPTRLPDWLRSIPEKITPETLVTL